MECEQDLPEGKSISSGWEGLRTTGRGFGGFMDSLRILVADDHETILFRALPGNVPRVKTCRHTFSPPEAAGIQRYVSPPARNIVTWSEP
jgi:hypothetical protein